MPSLHVRLFEKREGVEIAKKRFSAIMAEYVRDRYE